MPEADPTLSQDLDTMRALALAAGELAQSFQSNGKAARAWAKHGGSPVTEADVAVNLLCLKTLTAARPDYGWLSEETSDDRAMRQKTRCWVIDPIDGTRAYISGDPHWCVGLSVVENGEAVAGVIYAPALGELYEARKDGGAYLNGKKISVSDCSLERGCRLIASPKMISSERWKQPWPQVVIADPKPNATLLRMAFVASGAWDGALVLGRKSDWDLAAGTIIVEEAGGLATTHCGERFRFNQDVPAQRSIIASGKGLHPLLVQRSAIVSIPDPHQPQASRAPNKPTEPSKMGDASENKEQLLHIVFGGELKDVSEVVFEDLSQVQFVGAFANYADAYDAWKGAAHRTVDNAEMRFFILHAHKLLDPETGSHHHV